MKIPGDVVNYKDFVEKMNQAEIKFKAFMSIT